MSAHLSREFGVPFTVSESRRSSRISLRMDEATGGARVTVPAGARRPELLTFLRSHAAWIRDSSAAMPPRMEFIPGATLPVFGIARTIVAARGPTCEARLVGASSIVAPADGCGFAVARLLRSEASCRLEALARAKAARGPAGQPSSVTVGDPAGRWGACTSSGRISFSWRLALAPPDVSDYVAAHEVAHLSEMDHGPRFWELCRSLTRTDPAAARKWLAGNGAALHRAGPSRRA